MSKNRIVLVTGIILLILPMQFIGFPLAWKNFFYILIGLILVLLSIWSSIRGRLGLPSFERRNKDTDTRLFVDGHGQAQHNEGDENKQENLEPSA